MKVRIFFGLTFLAAVSSAIIFDDALPLLHGDEGGPLFSGDIGQGANEAAPVGGGKSGTKKSPRPVVIWHGLGDSYDSDGMNSAALTLRRAHPGTFVYAIQLSNNSKDDSHASFVGRVDNQIVQVAEQLKGIPELKDGFDAIGFSQGGLFLRGYAQLYNDPPVKVLLTFGSPHNGIASLSACGEHDFFCKRRNSLFESSVYSDTVQQSVVPAQYFRDPKRYEDYINKSGFLAAINNERANYHPAASNPLKISNPDAQFPPETAAINRNETFIANIAKLENLVMILFEKDVTVVPKESAWFQDLDVATNVLTPLEQRDLYTQEWIGLKQLGDAGKITYDTLPGAHMEIGESNLERLALKYFGN